MLQKLVYVLFASAVVLSLVGGDGPAAARVKVKKIIVVKGAGGDGFTPLFDGKSLKGWKTYLKDEKDEKKATESTFDEAAQKKALKESYEWNTTEATVKADGTIAVKINGVPVSTAKTELTSGPIGFQSEGARIHFKDIKIKMLD